MKDYSSHSSQEINCAIWGFHSADIEDPGLLGGRVGRSYDLAPLKTMVQWCFETSGCVKLPTTHWNIPEDQNPQEITYLLQGHQYYT